jgi:hypothetical protein
VPSRFGGDVVRLAPGNEASRSCGVGDISSDTPEGGNDDITSVTGIFIAARFIATGDRRVGAG